MTTDGDYSEYLARCKEVHDREAEQCFTCVHWLLQASREYVHRESFGVCRRNAPIADSTWPKVRPGDVCGEWRSAEMERLVREQIRANPDSVLPGGCGGCLR